MNPLLIVLLVVAVLGWVAFAIAAFVTVRDRLRVRRWKRWRR